MRQTAWIVIWMALAPVAGAGCGGAGTGAGAGSARVPNVPGAGANGWLDPEAHWIRGAADEPEPDARVNPDARVIAITGGTVLTAAGQRFSPGVVILAGGSIQHVGDASSDVDIPEDATVIDATGRYVTPGIIDSHSHLGVYPVPRVESMIDSNEMTDPVTASASAVYGYWSHDPGIPRALAGGVTTILVLPGSGNLIGGLGFAAVVRPGASASDVHFPGAPPSLKMACGENPKRAHGDKGGPMTRMGEYAAVRAVFRRAAEHNRKLAMYEKQRATWLEKRARAQERERKAAQAEGKRGRVKPVSAPEPPASEPVLEVLAAALRGEVLVQVHCYRSDDIRQMIDVADDVGITIRSFHHSLEAYKVRDLLVRRGIGINTWADWWGFKMEAFDGIPENAALFAESGGRAVIHSDSELDIQHLNQEAAKAMYAGRQAGIDVSEDEALRWITANPAWMLGIDEVTGTLEVGKRADAVVWDQHPFSVYSHADVVIQAGEVVYERADGRPLTDFELGNAAQIKGAQE